MNRIISALFFSCFALFVRSEDSQSAKVRFESYVDGIMQKYEGIGLSVALVKDNKIYYSKTFGYKPDYSNSQKRDTIRSVDVSWIASISKTFIATAVMQLVEEGRLALDDDVNNYLDFKISNPKYPEKPITIRMLMCHISSLDGNNVCNDFEKLSPQYNPNYKTYYTDFAPGTNYSYCNTGYNLLGAIIEKASGQRFDEYIDEHIMKPLGLYGGYDVSKLERSRLVWPKYYNQKTKKYLNVKNIYNYDKDKMDHYVLGYSTPCLYPPGRMTICLAV